MCLVVDLEKHPDLKPLIAKKRIEAYKVLYKRENEYHTPYQNKNVKFRFGIGVLKSRLEDPHGEIPRIDYGIHAYYKDDIILSIFSPDVLYEAYIPKGHPYFIGVGGEIVTDKLIIIKGHKKQKV